MHEYLSGKAPVVSIDGAVIAMTENNHHQGVRVAMVLHQGHIVQVLLQFSVVQVGQDSDLEPQRLKCLGCGLQVAFGT